MGKKVGLTYDLKTDWRPHPDDPQDANAELDSEETVEGIASALESGGHQTIRIGNVKNLLAQLDSLEVDIIFNICEGMFGRNREAQVPVILEMRGIPCVGADGLTMGIALDKIVAKKCFLADGLPTPRFFVADNSHRLKEQNFIGFPLIVKPHREGTSKGLTNQSRVEDPEALKRQVDLINQKYKQPALVEEFIKGTEFTVAVLGNEDPQAMPAIQVSIDNKLDLGDNFFTYLNVTSPDSVEYICPAKINRAVEEKIKEIAVRAYVSVGCRDFGRVDFRVDEKGHPFVLEINPLPSLAKKDAFNIFPQVLGSTYEETINKILNIALERYGLLNGSPKKLKASWNNDFRTQIMGRN